MTHPVDFFVGQRLRDLRIARGYTQTDVATRLGITFQQVQKYELGRNRISASRLHAAAKFLAVPVGYFFEGYDGNNPHTAPLVTPEEVRILQAVRRLSSIEERRTLLAFLNAIGDAT